MKNEDHLKEILSRIDEFDIPFDMEQNILLKIKKYEKIKLQIANYRAKAKKVMLVSILLIIVLGILFSLPRNFSTVENSIITYSSVVVVLIVLFIQLEISNTNNLNIQKNQ